MPKFRWLLENHDDPEGPIFEGSYVQKPPVYDGSFVVVTYNINLGLETELAAQELQEYEDLREADIILLQEMDDEGTELVARELGYNYVYYPASVHKHGRNFGNAILAPWPLSQPQKIILPHRAPLSQQMRIAVKAKVNVDDYEIQVFCVHTEVYSATRKHRREQVMAIVNDIGAGDDLVIVGGDFNTVSNRSIKRIVGQFDDIGLVRASKGSRATVVKYGLTPSAADHIFTRGMAVMDKGRVKHAKASDHFPLWVQLSPR